MDKAKQYFYSVGSIIVLSAACFVLSDTMGYRTAAFILLLAVSILAVSFDILPVLISAALSAFIWNFFFIPPRFTFHVATTEDTILFFMYFVIAMVNAVLTFKIRQIEKSARLKEEKANSVKLYNTILNSLSHELRTPIAAIIGATDNLQINNNLSDDYKEQLVAEISKASLRLNQQVENLLNISRLESGHIQPKNDWCDIVELIYDTVKQVEENNHNKVISISVDPNLPLCSIDKGMLEQVVYNLLNNAAIHTESEASIAITANFHVDVLEICVEDTGKTDFNIEEIFYKLDRHKTSGSRGSGLGLSIVKGFTEALGGTIEARRIKQRGTKFKVAIPAKTTFVKYQES